MRQGLDSTWPCRSMFMTVTTLPPEDCCAYTNAGTCPPRMATVKSPDMPVESWVRVGWRCCCSSLQATQGLKVGASGLGVFAPWRGTVMRPTGVTCCREAAMAFEKSGEFFGRDAVLGLFVGEFDFDVDRESSY